MKRSCVLAALGVALALAPVLSESARADEPLGDTPNVARAVELYGQARSRFDEGELQAALAAIEESLTLLDSPNSDLLRGHILRGLGRRVEAIEAYERALSGSKRKLLAGEARFEPTAAESGRWVGVLGADLAEVDVAVIGASQASAVSVGGRAATLQGGSESRTAKIWVEPGDIAVEVVDGSRRESKKLSASAGSAQRVLFDLRGPVAAAPADSSTALPPPAAWVAAGIGAAGMTAFAVLGGLVLATDAELADSCSPRCPASRLDEAERGERLQIGANVAVAVGAVGLATGAVIWIVDAATRTKAEPAALLRPGRGFVLRF
jgi:tetratricopeptide (TPR) repeat protein